MDMFNSPTDSESQIYIKIDGDGWSLDGPVVTFWGEPIPNLKNWLVSLDKEKVDTDGEEN